MQEANSEGLDIRSPDFLQCLCHTVFVEILAHVSPWPHSLTDLEAPASRHDRRWTLVVQGIHFRNSEAPHFKDIAEAAGRDQRRSGTFSLKNRVGCDCRRMNQTRNGVRSDIEITKCGFQAINNPLTIIIRCGQGFSCVRDTVFADNDQIGESAADVYANPDSGGSDGLSLREFGAHWQAD